jgi:hypothetical protein
LDVQSRRVGGNRIHDISRARVKLFAVLACSTSEQAQTQTRGEWRG